MTRDEYIFQHWVHAYHLRQFCDEEDHLCVFDKVEEKTFVTSPKKVAASDWFYDGKFEDPKTEKWLQKVEGAVVGSTGTYQKFVNLKSLNHSQITPGDVYRMALYMVVQELRTAAWRKVFTDISEQILEKYGDKMTDELRQEVEESLADDKVRELHVDSMKSLAKKSANFFAENMWWVLVENKTKKPFWTSDNPVVRDNEYDLSPYGSVGNLSPGLKVYFPLSPNVMLALYDPLTYSEEINFFPKQIYDEDVIRFFRDLQVVESSRQIYSPTNVFNQAIERIHETPEVASEDRRVIQMNPDTRDNGDE